MDLHIDMDAALASCLAHCTSALKLLHHSQLRPDVALMLDDARAMLAMTPPGPDKWDQALNALPRSQG